MKCFKILILRARQANLKTSNKKYFQQDQCSNITTVFCRWGGKNIKSHTYWAVSLECMKEKEDSVHFRI